jgi:Holliday junction resolvasome RuvABC endonuclease subunit
MRILGIDPGTRRLGWAVYDSELGLIEDSSCVDFKEKDVDLRLQSVRSTVHELIYEISTVNHHKEYVGLVDLVAYEMMFSTGNSADAPLAVCAWMIRMESKMAGVPVIGIPHTSAYKAVTEDGKSTKEDVQAVLCSLFCHEFLSTDESDAAAVALAAVNYSPKKKKPRVRKVQKASGDNSTKK